MQRIKRMLGLWIIAVVVLLHPIPGTAQQDNTIIYDEPVGGTFLDEAVQQWQFEAQAREIVQFNVQRIGGRFTPRLEVYTPDGTLLLPSISEADEVSQFIIFRQGLPVDGLYTVRVLEDASSSDGFLSVSEYTLTMTSRGRRLAVPDAGLTPLPTSGREDLPDFFTGDAVESASLGISVYGADTLPDSPPYILQGQGFSLQINNANPISRGVDAIAFTAQGIAVRSTTGAVFFAAQDIEQLSHLSGITEIVLANGQEITTDFYRISSMQALGDLLILRMGNQQLAYFEGEIFNFLRRGGISGEGPNAEPINRFLVDGREFQSDLQNWDVLSALAGELHVFYEGDLRFISDDFNVSLLGRGNSLRPELDDAGTDTRLIDITWLREDNPLPLVIDPVGMGDVVLRGGELSVLPLDGREISGEMLANLTSVLVEDEAVRLTRLDGTVFLSLPDATQISTPATLARDATAPPAEANAQPRFYNNLGTTIYDYTPQLTPSGSVLPVNRVLGNFVYPVQDFRIPSHSLSLDWSRTYNSMAPESQTPQYMQDAPQPYLFGQIGAQWRHSYQTELDITTAPLGEVTLILPDGSAHIFREQATTPGRFRSTNLLSWTIERETGLTGAWRATTTEGLIYQFDRAGRLQRIEDSFGEVLLFAPLPQQMAEDAGAAAGFIVVEPYGRRLEIYRNDANQIMLARDVQGRTIRYEYTDTRLTSAQYVAADEAASYSYDNGLLTSISDVHSPYYAEMRLIYDDLGRTLSYTINAEERAGTPSVETTFDYSQPQITIEGQFVNGEERITTWRYDDQFRLTETILPRPEWVYRYNYDSNTGRLAAIIQPNRTALRYEIDEYGYVTQFRDPLFAASSAYNLTYDSPDGYQRRLLRIDYPEQNEQSVYREYSYSTAEDGSLRVTETRPISSEEDDVFVVTRSYDERGRLIVIEEPAPDEGTIRSEYAYDDFGYVSQISQGNSLRLLLFQHDIAGRLVSLVDGRGTSITLVWDDDRDRVRRLLTDGVERSYTYDSFGNLVEYRRQDVIETYEYNGLNQVISVTDALGSETHYTYDEAGNLLSRTFPDDTVERYEYDALNNLTRATSRGGLITTYETALNIEGNRTRYTVTNPAQEQATYVYDAIGRLREVLVNDGEGVRIKTYTLSYNALGFLTRIEEGHVPGGRALTVQYDLLGNPLSSSIDGTETTYTYNAAGWLASITEPNGSSTQYDYDALGNITAVTLPDGAQQLYRYDENGNLVSFVDALGGETRYSYDDVNRVESMVDANGNRTSYFYDLRGNLTAIDDPRGNRISVQYDALGRLTSVLDALGNETRFEYDELSQLTRIVPPGGLDITTLTYDLEGNIVSASQPGDREYLYSRDSLGRIISVTNPLGQSTLYSYNNIGLVGRTVNALGNEQNYLWNGASQLVEYTSQDGKRYAYAADEIGRLTAITDVALDSQIAVNTRIEYDPSGYITAIRRGTSGNIASENAILYQYGYDAAGRLTSFQSPEAESAWEYQYDANGNLVLAINPQGVRTRYEYDAVGNLTRVTSASGTEEETVERYEYDEAGNIVAYTAPDGLLTRYEYDVNNRLIVKTEIANGESHSTRYEYDAQGRITRVTNPQQHATEIRYDIGNILLTRYLDDDTALEHRYFFDEVNNLTRIVLPGEQTINMTYNLLGQRVRYIDAESNGWSYAYDSAGRLAQVSDPQGNFVTYAYDGADRISSITYPTGAQETFRYDAQGNLRTVIFPENGSGEQEVIRYTFDQEGNLTSILHEPDDAPQTTYAYNDLGRVTQITQADGAVIDLEYNAQGRLVLVQSPDAISRRSYDAAGRLLSISDGAQLYTYEYDGFGQLQALSGTGDLEIQYAYDSLGNITLRDAGEYGRIETTYDALSRPVRVVMDGEGVNISYNANGWRTELTRDNGLRTTYSYDDNGRILSVIHFGADNARLDGLFYEYDAAGNIIRITRDDRWSVLFSYDEGQELISERWLNEINQLVYSVNYTYDLAGNRVEQVVRSNQENQVRTLYVYNEQNQLIEEYRDVPLSIEMGSLPISGLFLLLPLGFVVRRRRWMLLLVVTAAFAAPLIALAQDFVQDTDASVIYEYDENGNLILETYDSGNSIRYSYDAFNRLERVQGTNDAGERVNSLYAYDPLGRVREITMNGSRYELLYSADDFLAIRNVSSGTITRYYGAFPGEILLQESPQGAQWRLHDGLGSLRKLATASGELLDEELVGYNYTGFGVPFTPYGEGTAYELDEPQLLFMGALYDPGADLYLLGVRAYDPQLGRFLQRDPVRHDPEANLYTYAYNRPTTFADPSGLTPDAAVDGLIPPEITVDPLDSVESPLVAQPPTPPDVHALQAAENARILQVANLARYTLNNFTAVLAPSGCDLYLYEANPVPLPVRDILAQQNAIPVELFDLEQGAWLPPTQPDATAFVPSFAALNDALPLLDASYAGAMPMRGCPPGLMLPALPQPLSGLEDYQEREAFVQALVDVPMFGILAEALPELLNAEQTAPIADRPRVPTQVIRPLVNPPLPGQLTEMRIHTEMLYRMLLLPQPLPNEANWRTLSQVNDYSPPVLFQQDAIAIP